MFGKCFGNSQGFDSICQFIDSFQGKIIDVLSLEGQDFNNVKSDYSKKDFQAPNLFKEGNYVIAINKANQQYMGKTPLEIKSSISHLIDNTSIELETKFKEINS